MIAYKEVYDWLFMLRFLSMYKVCCRIVATQKKTWTFLDLLPLIPLGYIVTVITHYMNEFVLYPSGGPPSMSCNQVVVIPDSLQHLLRDHYGAYYRYGVRYKQDIFPQIFLGPCATKDPEGSTATSNRNDNKFICNPQKVSVVTRLERGALRIFTMTLGSCRHKLRGVLNAGPCSLLHLHDGPLHHRLLGDLGLPAPEACQYMLCHHLCRA
jgi:hypothetical protein